MSDVSLHVPRGFFSNVINSPSTGSETSDVMPNNIMQVIGGYITVLYGHIAPNNLYLAGQCGFV